MKLKTEYDERGYIILRNFYNPQDILCINHCIEPIYKKWVNDNQTDIFDYKLVNMHSLTHTKYFNDQSENRVKFFDVIASTKLTNLLDKIFKTEIYFHNTQLFFNPTNKSLKPYWHRDLQYSPIDDNEQKAQQNSMLSLHVRIPLIPEKGVELISGSHKRWDTDLEKKVRFEVNDETHNYQSSDPLPNSVLIDLSPGDILIFNAQMIHRGNYALNKERKALDLCVGTYHSFNAQYLDEDVLPTDKEIKEINHNEWYALAKNIIQERNVI